MKVALYKSAFLGPSDGAAETLVSYATELAVAGHVPTVILMYPNATDSQYTRRLDEQGVRWEYLSSGKVALGLNLLRRIARKIARNSASLSYGRVAAERIFADTAARYRKVIQRIIRSTDVDLLHVLGASPGTSRIVEMAQNMGLPVLYHELGSPEDGANTTPYHTRLSEALQAGAHVAALSPSLVSKCRETYVGADHLTVLPLIVEDLGCGSLSAAPEVVFGFSGRVETMKGAECLAQAFALLRQRQNSVRLRIAGTGSQASAVAKMLEESGATGRFEFTGPYTSPEAKRAFMHSIDVLVHPSLSEGTPNSIIEAMSAGLPVIASAVGGIPDVVSSESGILVPAGDSCALADAMEHLAREPALRQRMGAAGRSRYELYFSAASVMPLLLRRYRSVSSAHRQSPTTTAGAGSFHPWADVEAA